MKKILKRIVKSSRWIFQIYYHIGSLLLRIAGIFFLVKENLVLFVVYGGQRYDDSPRFVYEYMKQREEYRRYQCKWAFIEPEKMTDIPENEKVRIDTWEYYKTALMAGYWITNSSVSRGLNFKKKKTVNILFQHGMAGLKKLGTDIKKDNKSFRNGFSEKFDMIFLEGKKEDAILKNAWQTDGKEFYLTGLPRNDELLRKTDEEIESLKQKLGIPLDKKVILYAPTFREYNRDSQLATFLKPPFDFDLWERELGAEYVLILTAHYEVAKLMDVPENHPFIINAFKYPHINDLLLVSDILVSDYSSVIWDYSILERPIISYAYDFEEYQRERGLYDGYEEIFSQGVMQTQEQVISFIKSMDYLAECVYTRQYMKEKYVVCAENTAEKCTELIFNMRG